MAKHAPPPDLQARLLEYDDAPLEGGYYDSAEVPAPTPEPRRSPASKFTPERCARILEDIRRGCYLHVAARANGVTAATLARWLRDPTPEYQAFAEQLDEAQAQARVDAEHRVHAEKPAVWLKLGPGRDFGDPSKPGWTAPPRRVEGRHEHAHLHAGVHRAPADLSRLSLREVEQLEGMLRKVLPAGAGAAIEVAVDGGA